MRTFPRVAEHPFEIYLFLAVRTGLFLADDAPTADAEFVKHMVAAQFVRGLDDAVFVRVDQQLVAADRANVRLQLPGRHAGWCVVADV